LGAGNGGTKKEKRKTTPNGTVTTFGGNSTKRGERKQGAEKMEREGFGLRKRGKQNACRNRLKRDQNKSKLTGGPLSKGEKREAARTEKKVQSFLDRGGASEEGTGGS